MFGEGISKVGEILDLGVEYGIVKKAVPGTVTEKQGWRKDVMPQNVFKDNPELAAEIEAKIFEAVQSK